MCGRFAIFSKPDDYIQQLGLNEDISACPIIENYNAYPTQSLPVVYRNHENIIRCDLLHWGLIPSWAKDNTIGYKTSNARSETAAEKPSFRHAFKKQRCLIPVDGWYEWKREGKNKQPYFHHRKDNQVTWLAGLWESWVNPETAEYIESFSVLTQDAKGNSAQIHNRMPVFINPNNSQGWLDSSLNDKQLIYNLTNYMPEDDYEIYPVSSKMNSPKFQGQGCIDQI